MQATQWPVSQKGVRTRVQRAWRWAGIGAGLALCCGMAAAQSIYTCVDGSGKRHTSDRPIPECLDREQRELNRDGSQRRVVPPRMNAEERAAAEEQARRRALAEAARKDAIRRDRNLMARYPDEATHHKARQAALDDWTRTIEVSERQLHQLEEDRKPLEAEAEFYVGRRLPAKLKAQLDANEAQQQAQRDAIQTQRAEMTRINALYDAELARLKRLWAGEPPGTSPSQVAPPTAHETR